MFSSFRRSFGWTYAYDNRFTSNPEVINVGSAEAAAEAAEAFRGARQTALFRNKVSMDSTFHCAWTESTCNTAMH